MPADLPLESGPDASPWQFLTNHTYVLLAITRNPDIRQREIADQVGITEGAVQRIVHELEEAGALKHQRIGRRNRYEVVTGHGLRHRIAQTRTIGEILDVLADPTRPDLT